MNDLQILPPAPTLDMIRRLQLALSTVEQTVMEPVHHFAAGVYVRELPMPAETVIVGKMHRYDHIVMLTKGDVTIYTDDGKQRIAAPHVWHAKAGSKRVIHTHADSVILTVHANPLDETDLDAIEANVIVPEKDELDALALIPESLLLELEETS